MNSESEKQDAFRRIGDAGSDVALNNGRMPSDGRQSGPVLSNGPMGSSGELSVEIVPDRKWFVIRATMGRAESVNRELVKRGFETFLPTEIIPLSKKNIKNDDEPYEEISIFKWLLFVKCTEGEFEELVKYSGIPGLTPYYNHFRQNDSGRDLYLTVPYVDMESFITVIRSTNQDVKIGFPKFGEPFTLGEWVRVTEGEFKGVEGRVKRFLGSRRVVVTMDFIGYAATSYIPQAFLERIERKPQENDINI